MPLLRSNTRFTKGLRAPGWCTPEYFGAVGSGAVNDYPAFLAAKNALAADGGGGEIRLTPGRSYRLDTKFVMDGKVSITSSKGLIGTADSRIIRNHTNACIEVNTVAFSDDETPSVIEGVKFEDAQAVTAPMIDVNGGSLDLVRCFLLGSAFTNGVLLSVGAGITSVTRLLGSTVLPANAGVPAVEVTIGSLHATGSRFVRPAIHDGPLINVSSVSAFDPAIAMFTGNNYFDAVWAGYSSGSSQFINGEGDYYNIVAHGNVFRSPSDNVAVARWVAEGGGASGTVGRRINMEGNSIDGCSYYLYAGTPLDLGSELQLLPFNNSSTSGSTPSLPAGVASYTLRSTGTAPTIFLPPILFAGQEFILSIYNNSGGNWGGITISGGVPTGHPGLLNGAVRTQHWKAMDWDGSGTITWNLISSR